MATYPEFDPNLQPWALGLRPLALRGLAGSPSGLLRAVAVAERVAALGLLALALPVLLAACAAVSVLSRRCPLVAHERVGQYGRRIWVVKLRTMWRGGGRRRRGAGWLIERLRLEPVPESKRSGDPRVTSRFAAFCRKYSIDELPQLWNVVTGELALVGPRPLTPQELKQHYGRAAAEVLRMKPGLTGLWQVKGRSRLGYWQRRRLDLFLVRNWSLRLYVRIVLTTVPRVITGKDAC